MRYLTVMQRTTPLALGQEMLYSPRIMISCAKSHTLEAHSLSAEFLIAGPSSIPANYFLIYGTFLTIVIR